GDQGMMFGYACNDTKEYLPVAMVILQKFAEYYDTLVHSHEDFYPDGKAQITGIYDDDFNLVKIKDFTVSYNNSEKNREVTDRILEDYLVTLCKEYGLEVERFLINPTGKFLIGGFEGDAGLTGRKIVVDSYQSFANVGGGCMNGKDPTKVDLSGAYIARVFAKELLEEKRLKWCEVQLSYAIGMREPLAIYIDSDQGNLTPPQEWYTRGEPKNIIEELQMKKICYEKQAMYGHFRD
ncbi:MAG: methionine adenosyltransferase domain-containing protein, partial [Erysipelotrichaceae bacterium]|nr:methionine adenosyltransferase domain-containing protein [Erysipelotrichaceae bacterium]